MAADHRSPGGPNRPRTHPRGGVPWGLRVGVRAVFALLSLGVIVGSGVAWSTYKNFSEDVPHGAAVPGASADADGNGQNILLLGSDTRAGATRAELKALHAGHDTTTANADSMMVMHIPAKGGAPTLVSFPRDSWVEIPGHGMGKINSAYPDAYNTAKQDGSSELASQSAGIRGTISAIQHLTGLRIDHYMQVNLLGFYRISEAIGGVEVCLKNAQNKQTEDGRGDSGIDLPAGTSTIKGSQALAFVRQRHGLPHGDLDRVKRQQYFLKAAFQKMTSAGTLLNPFKLQHMLDAVGRSMLTDPGLDLIKLARQLQSLTSGKIDVETIPNNGPKLIYPDGVETAIVEVNRAGLPAFIKQLEGRGVDALKQAKAAPAGSVTVDVLNGTDVPRLAARNADGMKQLGFAVNQVGSTDPSRRTEVRYPPGKEAAAKAVLAAVPHAKAVADPDVERVTVVVGMNRTMVRGVTPPPASATASGDAGASGPSSAAGSEADGLGCID